MLRHSFSDKLLRLVLQKSWPKHKNINPKSKNLIKTELTALSSEPTAKYLPHGLTSSPVAYVLQQWRLYLATHRADRKSHSLTPSVTAAVANRSCMAAACEPSSWHSRCGGRAWESRSSTQHRWAFRSCTKMVLFEQPLSTRSERQSRRKCPWINTLYW